LIETHQYEVGFGSNLLSAWRGEKGNPIRTYSPSPRRI